MTVESSDLIFPESQDVDTAPLHSVRSRSQPLLDMLPAILSDFAAAGLQMDSSLVHRFIASLLTKRFVILTGLSGSGKTKLAQAFAAWITVNTSQSEAWPQVGDEIPSDRITYFVDAADSISIQFSNSRDANTRIKVTLPRELIQEWVDCIEETGFSRATPARDIRNTVDNTTRYSPQLNSFETNLKAAAFAFLDNKIPDILFDQPCYQIVAVGADWTSNEHVLGYPDALNPSRYVRTQTLDLILRAIANPFVPHFLILDEMNLSHVERYFADFLSAIETGEKIHLYEETDPDSLRDGVPPSLRIPPNLFTIGTVNIDETTYMFSPKVLDRANTVEFRVSENEIGHFLSNPTGVSIPKLRGKGIKFASPFLAASQSPISASDPHTQAMLNAELLMLFRVLSAFGFEFGYRSAFEISCFLQRYSLLSNDYSFEEALDAQIYQKFLPRLNGSRARLEPVLLSLAYLCHAAREWKTGSDSLPILANSEQLVQQSLDASTSTVSYGSLDGLSADTHAGSIPIYPLSSAKLRRMSRLLRQNGFTSFAEA